MTLSDAKLLLGEEKFCLFLEEESSCVGTVSYRAVDFSNQPPHLSTIEKGPRIVCLSLRRSPVPDAIGHQTETDIAAERTPPAWLSSALNAEPGPGTQPGRSTCSSRRPSYRRPVQTASYSVTGEEKLKQNSRKFTKPTNIILSPLLSPSKKCERRCQEILLMPRI